MKQGNARVLTEVDNSSKNMAALDALSGAASRNANGWEAHDSNNETEKTGVRTLRRATRARRLSPAPLLEGSSGARRATPTDENSSLENYFRGLASRPLLSAEGEQKASLAIEDAEIEHWAALLSYPPVALLVLGRAHARSEREPSEVGPLPTSTALHEIARRLDGGAAASDADQRALWKTESDAYARTMRVWDSDRTYLTEANAFVGMLGQQPNLNAGTSRDEAAEWQSYLARVVSADRKRLRAIDHFVEANLRLVIGVARRYAKGRMPLVDLIQEGNLGLITAVMRFDHRRGYRFATYAIWWVRHSICRALSNKGRTVRVPANLLRSSARVNKAAQKLMTQTGREADADEIAKLTGIKKRELERVQSLRAAGEVLSLDRARDDEGDSETFLDSLSDDEARAPEEHTSDKLDSASVRRAFGVLTPIEANVLSARFGLTDGEEQSLDEIGRRHGLSRERIRQIQVKALAKLKQAVAGCELSWT
jgi:RNA polymerase primary sigma factor